MQNDPFSRRRTVKVIAVFDMCLAAFLVGYAVVRLVQYDYSDQSIMYLLSRKEKIVISLLYWIVTYCLLSFQILMAFLLLTATLDMTSDPDTMMIKCVWWRTLSTFFLIMVLIDVIVLLYEYFANDLEIKVVRMAIDGLEILFRGFGVWTVGRFIAELHSLYETPMVQYANGGIVPPSPVPELKNNKRYHQRGGQLNQGV